MDHIELLEKTLRAILKMNKGRLSLARLKSEYKLLTGENIAYKDMGHNNLVSLLASMPSIMYIQRSQFGEMMCYSSEASEKSPAVSKETGRPHLVNNTRARPAAPRVLNVRPQTSVRQHSHRGHDVFFTVTRDIRVVDRERRSGTQPDRSARLPSEKPPSSLAALSPDVKLKLKELLFKFPHGLWATALPQVFQDNYKTKLPPHVLENLHLLGDFCDVVCPLPDNRKKAILLYRVTSEESKGGK